VWACTSWSVSWYRRYTPPARPTATVRMETISQAIVHER
jgi:hypothetical protein